MNSTAFIGVLIAIGAVISAYYYGFSIGYAAGRDEGFGDGRREGSREGSMRGYAVGFDRGKRQRDGSDDDSGHARGGLGLGIAGLALIGMIIAILMNQSQDPVVPIQNGPTIYPAAEPTLSPRMDPTPTQYELLDEPSID